MVSILAIFEPDRYNILFYNILERIQQGCLWVHNVTTSTLLSKELTLYILD